MKDAKEKIDILLQRSAAEQLENVDWDKLNTAISQKLDEAESNKLYAKKCPSVFKIAASIAAAAAIIFIAVMVKTEPPHKVKFEKSGKAVVRLIDTKGIATVKIEQEVSKSRVMIDFEDSSRKIARCYIKIIDSKGDLKRDSDQPMWIIISKSEPMVADNGYSDNEYEMDLICLL